MAKKLNRPTDTNFNGFSFDFSGVEPAQKQNVPELSSDTLQEIEEYNRTHLDKITPADLNDEEKGWGNDIVDWTKMGLHGIGGDISWLLQQGSEAIGADDAAKFFGNTAKKFEGWKEEARRDLSAESKLAGTRKFIEEDPDGGLTIGKGLTSGRAIIGSAVESLPSMAAMFIPGVGLAGKATSGLSKVMNPRLAAGVGGALGFGTAEGAITGVQDAHEAYDRVMGMPLDTLRQSEEFNAIAAEIGEDKARKMLADDIAKAVGLKAGAATAALGAGPGWVMGRMMGGETGKTLVRSILKGMGAEGAEEFLQSGAEGYIGNVEAQRADPSINPWDDVANQAVGGALAGGLMGGPFGAFGHSRGVQARALEEEQEAADQAERERLAAEEEARRQAELPTWESTQAQDRGGANAQEFTDAFRGETSSGDLGMDSEWQMQEALRDAENRRRQSRPNSNLPVPADLLSNPNDNGPATPSGPTSGTQSSNGYSAPEGAEYEYEGVRYAKVGGRWYAVMPDAQGNVIDVVPTSDYENNLLDAEWTLSQPLGLEQDTGSFPMGPAAEEEVQAQRRQAPAIDQGLDTNPITTPAPQERLGLPEGTDQVPYQWSPWPGGRSGMTDTKPWGSQGEAVSSGNTVDLLNNESTDESANLRNTQSEQTAPQQQAPQQQPEQVQTKTFTLDTPQGPLRVQIDRSEYGTQFLIHDSMGNPVDLGLLQGNLSDLDVLQQLQQRYSGASGVGAGLQEAPQQEPFQQPDQFYDQTPTVTPSAPSQQQIIPQPVPTEQQVTNPVQEPRGDVINAAEQTGMPVPNPVPEEAQVPDDLPPLPPNWLEDQMAQLEQQQAPVEQTPAPEQEAPVQQPVAEGVAAGQQNVQPEAPVTEKPLDISVVNPQDVNQKSQAVVDQIESPFKDGDRQPSHKYLVNTNEHGVVGVRIDRNADGTQGCVFFGSESEGGLLGYKMVDGNLTDEQIIDQNLAEFDLTREQPVAQEPDPESPVAEETTSEQQPEAMPEQEEQKSQADNQEKQEEKKDTRSRKELIDALPQEKRSDARKMKMTELRNAVAEYEASQKEQKPAEKAPEEAPAPEEAKTVEEPKTTEEAQAPEETKHPENAKPQEEEKPAENAMPEQEQTPENEERNVDTLDQLDVTQDLKVSGLPKTWSKPPKDSISKPVPIKFDDGSEGGATGYSLFFSENPDFDNPDTNSMYREAKPIQGKKDGDTVSVNLRDNVVADFGPKNFSEEVFPVAAGKLDLGYWAKRNFGNSNVIIFSTKDGSKSFALSRNVVDYIVSGTNGNAKFFIAKNFGEKTSSTFTGKELEKNMVLAMNGNTPFAATMRIKGVATLDKMKEVTGNKDLAPQEGFSKAKIGEQKKSQAERQKDLVSQLPKYAQEYLKYRKIKQSELQQYVEQLQRAESHKNNKLSKEEEKFANDLAEKGIGVNNNSFNDKSVNIILEDKEGRWKVIADRKEVYTTLPLDKVLDGLHRAGAFPPLRSEFILSEDNKFARTSASSKPYIVLKNENGQDGSFNGHALVFSGKHNIDEKSSPLSEQVGKISVKKEDDNTYRLNIDGNERIGFNKKHYNREVNPAGLDDEGKSVILTGKNGDIVWADSDIIKYFLEKTKGDARFFLNDYYKAEKAPTDYKESVPDFLAITDKDGNLLGGEMLIRRVRFDDNGNEESFTKEQVAKIENLFKSKIDRAIDADERRNGIRYTPEQRAEIERVNTDDQRFAEGETKPAEKQEKPSEKPAEQKKPKEASTEKKPNENSAKKEKIQDFGEKIGGAKKDLWGGLQDRLNIADKDSIANQPLSKIFPEPNYTKLIADGVDPKAVSFIRSVRDYIAREKKRSKRWRPDFAEKIKSLIDTVSRTMSEPRLLNKFIEGMNLSEGMRREILGDMELYQAAGHEESMQNKYTYKEEVVKFRNGHSYKEPITTYVVYDEHWREVAFSDKSKEDALNQFKEYIEKKRANRQPESTEKKPREKKKIPISLYSHYKDGKKTIHAGFKIKHGFKELAGPFDSVKEGRDYINEHEDELQKKIEELRTVPSERRNENAPRVGDDYLKGKDATPEMFSEAFGFRGVEFGNWVNSKERQAGLNDAYNALMDLAGILNISPKAISLNGELGLAFGARGSGKASAHYEPGKVVINLTKTKGAGSLAHEWLHAMDNYFSRKQGKNLGYMSDQGHMVNPRNESQAEIDGVRRVVLSAWKDVINAIRSSGMRSRSNAIDAMRAKPYWGTNVEMAARAFESYVINKLEENGYSNDYLANIVSDSTWNELTHGGHGYPYPLKEELPAISKAFDDFFNTVEEKETENGNVALYSIAPGQFLPEQRASGPRATLRQVQNTVNDLQSSATNAAKTKVVATEKELPENLRGKEGVRHEGVYDASTDTVYIVAETCGTTQRAAEVWTHEQIVHHGLHGLLSYDQRSELFSKLFTSMGGMKNSLIWEIAKRYDLNPKDNVSDKMRTMEEAIASLAEKKSKKLLSNEQSSLWDKIVSAVKNMINKVIYAVTGRQTFFGNKEVDSLLTALSNYVMRGVDSEQAQGRLEAEPAYASKFRLPETKTKEPEEKIRYRQIRRDRPSDDDIVLLPNKQDVFGEMPLTRLYDGRILKKAPFKLCRGWDSMGIHGRGVEHIQKAHGEEIRNAGYSGIQEFVWDLVNRYSEIWEGEEKTLLLVARGGRGKSGGFIEFKQNGGFYEVNTAFPPGPFYPDPRKRKLLWKRGTDAPIATDKLNPFTQGLRSNLNRAEESTAKQQRTQKMSEGSLQRRKGQSSEKTISQNENAVKDQSIEERLRQEAEDLKPYASIMVNAHGQRTLFGKLKDFAFNAFDPEMRQIARLDHSQVQEIMDDEDISRLRATIGVPHGIARKSEGFNGVYQVQLKRDEIRSAMNKKSIDECHLLYGPKAISGKDLKDLQRIAYELDGKTFPEEQGIDQFIDDPTLSGPRRHIMVNPDYYDAYQKILDKQTGSAKAKEAMMQLRKSLDHDFVRVFNKMCDMKDVHDGIIKTLRTEIKALHNYMPHQRRGKYYFSIVDDNGVTLYREHFDAADDRQKKLKAEALWQKHKNEYPGNPRVGTNRKMPEDVMGALVDYNAMEQILQASVANLPEGDIRNEVFNTLVQNVADMYKQRGFGSHALHRKDQGIPGFIKDDILGTVHDYKMGLNGWLTKIDAAAKFGQALAKIDAQKEPNTYGYAKRYVQDMLRNSDRLDRIVGNTKGLFFFWFLGGSMKSAAVNATGNLVVGIPRMGEDIPKGRVGLWLRAAADSIGKNKKLKPEEKDMLDTLYNEKIVNDQYNQEVQGDIARGFASTGLGKAAKKVAQWLGLPMGIVEKFNRASLALAVYRAAKAGNLYAHTKQKYGIHGTATHEQAMELARNVVLDSHFQYGKANYPQQLRGEYGRIASPVYTFRQFSHNLLDLWGYWLFSKEGRAKGGVKHFAESLAANVTLAGLAGIPFFATISALCTAASGDDEDLKTKIKRGLKDHNLLRDLICYGAPSLGGINIGGSLALETPIQAPISKGKDLKDTAMEVIWNGLGIPASMIDIVNKSATAASYGQYSRAVEELSPVFAKNIMSAYRQYTSGQVSAKGYPLDENNKLSKTEAFGKALGFQPLANTKNFEAKQAADLQQNAKTRMVTKLAMLEKESQEEKLKAKHNKMLTQLRAWNRRMKEEGKEDLIIEEKKIYQRVKQWQTGKKPTKTQKRVKEELGAA